MLNQSLPEICRLIFGGGLRLLSHYQHTRTKPGPVGGHFLDFWLNRSYVGETSTFDFTTFFYGRL